jgi:hypothetical protein
MMCKKEHETPYEFISFEARYLLDVAPCSLVKVYGRFGETYCLHLQSLGKAKQPTSKKQAEVYLLLASCSLFDPEDGGITFLRNMCYFLLLNYTAPHPRRWYSQNVVLFADCPKTSTRMEACSLLAVYAYKKIMF